VVTVVVLGGGDIFGGARAMLGGFLALLLIAGLKKGVQLANNGGATPQNLHRAVLPAAHPPRHDLAAPPARGPPRGEGPTPSEGGGRTRVGHAGRGRSRRVNLWTRRLTR